MPGNYELYDQSTNRLGPVICKLCWELFSKHESSSINTVWVSSEGRRMIWWLCGNHMETLRAEASPVQLLKSVQGVVFSPGI